MSKYHYFLSVVLGLGVLAMNPLTAEAQRGGGRGGGGGGRGAGASHWGGGHAAVGHAVNFASLHHEGFAVTHHGSFANLHHGRFDGRGRNSGFSPWFGNGFFGPYGYPYGLGYYDSYYGGQPYVSSSPLYVGPPYNYTGPVNSVAPTTPTNTTAELDVSLPVADAQVWVDGKRMPFTPSTQRSYVTPPLQPGQSSVYHMTAVWMENGQEVRVERKVPVTPGRTATVDFTSVNTAQVMPPSGN